MKHGPTSRQRARRLIEDAIRFGKERGFEGLELRRYVRTFDVSCSGESGSYRLAFRQEFVRAFKGIDFAKPRRPIVPRVDPLPGQLDLF